MREDEVKQSVGQSRPAFRDLSAAAGAGKLTPGAFTGSDFSALMTKRALAVGVNRG